jgi:hypothetical protein
MLTISHKFKTLAFCITTGLLVLTACVQAEAAAVLGSESKPSCFDEIPGAINFVNEAYGYCFAYPNTYELEEINPDVVAVYWGSLLDVEHPKAFIVVQNASGLKAEKVADEIVARYPGFYIGRNSDLKIDGEAAVMLDGVPGQDISRKVILVHQDLLYVLTFLPADETHLDIYNEMVRLYKTITRSFQFIHAGSPIAPLSRLQLE